MKNVGKERTKMANRNMPFTKEEIDAANNASVAEYCNVARIALTDESGELRGVEHDSLVIRPQRNDWYWNSENQHGTGALSFVERYEMAGSNLSDKDKFKLAMKKVMDSGVSIVDPEKAKHIKRPDFQFNQRQVAKTNEKAENYLHGIRKISMSTLHMLEKQGNLMQRFNGDVIFPWRDENGKICGATRQGTDINYTKYGKRGTNKKIEKNSKYSYGFNFDTPDLNKGEAPSNIRFFEAPIDAISQYDLAQRLGKPIKDTRFVSMDGLKDEVVRGYIQRWGKELTASGKKPKSIMLCCDNDEAGENFIHKIQAKHPNIKNGAPSKKFPGKDWNDALKSIDHLHLLKRDPKEELKKQVTQPRKSIQKATTKEQESSVPKQPTQTQEKSASIEPKKSIQKNQASMQPAKSTEKSKPETPKKLAQSAPKQNSTVKRKQVENASKSQNGPTKPTTAEDIEKQIAKFNVKQSNTFLENPKQKDEFILGETGRVVDNGNRFKVVPIRLGIVKQAYKAKSQKLKMNLSDKQIEDHLKRGAKKTIESKGQNFAYENVYQEMTQEARDLAQQRANEQNMEQ